MNEILCPHCQKNIALEEGAFGLFDCPHCDEEFSWDSDRKKKIDNVLKWTNVVGAVVCVIGLIGVIGLLIWFVIFPPSGMFGGFQIIFPIGIILIGASINLIAVMMWGFNKLITTTDSTPPPEVIIFFGVTVFTIFWIMTFYLFSF